MLDKSKKDKDIHSISMESNNDTKEKEKEYKENKDQNRCCSSNLSFTCTILPEESVNNNKPSIVKDG